MNTLIIRKLIPKLAPLIVASMVSVYFAAHPPGKAFIKSQMPPIQVLELPRVTLEEEAIEIPKQSLRNPFLPSTVLRPREEKEEREGISKSGHILSMILIGRKKTCIIDGQAVKEGEEVTKGVRVLKILPQGVWISENGKESFIPLILYR